MQIISYNSKDTVLTISEEGWSRMVGWWWVDHLHQPAAGQDSCVVFNDSQTQVNQMRHLAGGRRQKMTWSDKVVLWDEGKTLMAHVQGVPCLFGGVNWRWQKDGRKSSSCWQWNWECIFGREDGLV